MKFWRINILFKENLVKQGLNFKNSPTLVQQEIVRIKIFNFIKNSTLSVNSKKENPTRNNIKISYCIIFSYYVNLDSEFFLVRADLRVYFCYSRKISKKNLNVLYGAYMELSEIVSLT